MNAAQWDIKDNLTGELYGENDVPDGIPDNYMSVINPGVLDQQLGEIVKRIKDDQKKILLDSVVVVSLV